MSRRILLSLFVDRLRTVLPIKGSLRRAKRRALDSSGPFWRNLTLQEGKQDWENYDSDTLLHGDTRHALLHIEAPAQRGGGWMPKLFVAPSSRESFFS